MDTNQQQELKQDIKSTLKSIWKVQAKDYNIEDNYPDITGLLKQLDAQNSIEEVKKINSDIQNKCKFILENESPQRDPEVFSAFNDKLAPVPNNPVVKAFFSALHFAGEKTDKLENGWQVRGNSLLYEMTDAHGGVIKIKPKLSRDNQDGSSLEKQWAFVKSISALTADIAMAVLAQVCNTYCESKTNNPQQQETLVSSKKLLEYKCFKSRGKRYWDMNETIAKELEKIQALEIIVKNFKSPAQQVWL